MRDVAKDLSVVAIEANVLKEEIVRETGKENVSVNAREKGTGAKPRASQFHRYHSSLRPLLHRLCLNSHRISVNMTQITAILVIQVVNIITTNTIIR